MFCGDSLNFEEPMFSRMGEVMVIAKTLFGNIMEMVYS